MAFFFCPVMFNANSSFDSYSIHIKVGGSCSTQIAQRALGHWKNQTTVSIDNMAAPKVVLHLRSEQKPLEHRSCLTPTTAKTLIEAGYQIDIERSPSDPSRRRIFADEEFSAIGANLVADQSWTSTPAR
jgi:hypothetical protein